ncbi:MAG: rod shape-determining protein MreC [Candidatus Omnitrophica bacterium]|nr:rod shape-determining protein MreC [Candidatus Omnitrophota bacterium]
MFNLKNKNLILVLSIVSFIVLLSLSVVILVNPLISMLRYPLGFVSAIQREVGGVVFYHRNLVQNDLLKREVDYLKNKLNSMNEIYLENLRLKEILSLKQRSPFKFISARVIARSADNWSSGLIIDKGSYSGIKKGMAAVTYLGLIGRVIETTNQTAKVMLLTDPNLGVSSLIQRSRQEGLVCGTLGSNLIMKYLPEDADIKLQDVIVSSGLNNSYPKGLLIGRVVDIGNEFSGLSKYAIIRPEAQLSNIEEVLIAVQ